LEFKSQNEIDLDETSILLLGCGHCFTADSLDGMVGISQVYDIDVYGDLIGLKNSSPELAQSVPKCPDCKCTIRQYTTQRCNRVITRAIIDEASKRFLVSRQESLWKLETEIEELKEKLDEATVCAAREAAVLSDQLNNLVLVSRSLLAIVVSHSEAPQRASKFAPVSCPTPSLLIRYRDLAQQDLPSGSLAEAQ